MFQGLYAQSGIKVKATVDKPRILIGEHFVLNLEVDVPENEAIRFFIIDTIPHFEFLDKKSIDTNNTSNGTILTQQVRMTSFDSGRWVIPAFVLQGNIATDSIPIDVSFSSPFDPNQEYHDVKDVMDVEMKDKKEEEWWWWAAGGALLLILALYLLLRKKPKPKPVLVIPVDPYKDAMDELDKLEKNRPDTKRYYSVLVDTFRLYISRKKGITSLQKTTDDLVVQLKQLELGKSEFDRLAQALRLSDFVKFAKYEPEAVDDRQTMETIRESIRVIEKSTPDTGKKEGGG